MTKRTWKKALASYRRTAMRRIDAPTNEEKMALVNESTRQRFVDRIEKHQALGKKIPARMLKKYEVYKAKAA